MAQMPPTVQSSLPPRKVQRARARFHTVICLRWDTSYGLPDPQTKYSNGNYGVTNYFNTARFGGLYPEGTKLYNNLDQILQTGFTQVHNVSVETGTEKLTMRAACFIHRSDWHY